MVIDKTKMAESLKILAENPGKIKAQEKLYQERLSAIMEKEKSGNWSPNTIAREKAEAKEARDRVSHALANAMVPALAYVRANNDYTSIPVDLENGKLNRALDMVSLLGKNMSFSDQVGIINQFRGDHGSLRVLEAAFQKNGNQWAADVAREMQKPISEQALSELSEVLAFHSHAEKQGYFNFPAEKMMWTHGSFQKQADRLGLDLNGIADPYSLALDMTLDNLNEAETATMEEADPEKAAKSRAWISAQRYRIALAKQEISNAAKTGADPTQIFNKALSAAEKAAAPEA